MKQALPDSTGLSPIKFTFTFKPKNSRKKPKHSQNKIRNVEPGNIPRLSKLMALAIRFEGLVKRGELRDYADLARLGYVTRARITQIMNLLNLAPDIQEELLFLPRTVKGRDPICEKDMRPIVTVPYWQRQRKMWAKLAAQRLR
jgi:hypothetical protein